MKNFSGYLVIICTLVLISTGCAFKKDGVHPEPSGGKALNAPDETENLSANYYYLESQIHINNKSYEKAQHSLEKALALDPDSYVLTQDLVFLHIRNNDRQKAMELVERLIQKNPDNVDGLLLYVQLKKSDIDEDELIRILNHILEIDPANKETYVRLAKIYIEKQAYPPALDILEKMVERFPDYYVGAFYLGDVHKRLEHYEKAKTNFLKSIDLEPGLITPRFELIDIYRFEKQPGYRQKIMDIYEDILNLEPDNQQAFIGLALQYYKTGKKEQAQEMFDELATEIKNDSRMIMTAMDQYISGKQYEDAVTILTQMLKTDPESSDLNFFLGMVYQDSENPKKAIRHYLKVTPDHFQYKKTVLSIAFLYKELNSTQTALNYLETQYKAFPKDIDFATYLSSFYEGDNQFEKAMDVIKKGLETSPENTTLLFRLGAIQDKAGNKQESIAIMKRIIEIDPKDAGALNYLGYTYAELGVRLEEALSLIQKAYRLKPDDGYITDSLGWVYYKIGNYEKALEYLKKAADITSFETIIAAHLGDVYIKLKLFEKALDAYNKAVSNATDDDKERIEQIKLKIKTTQKKLND